MNEQALNLEAPTKPSKDRLMGCPLALLHVKGIQQRPRFCLRLQFPIISEWQCYVCSFISRRGGSIARTCRTARKLARLCALGSGSRYEGSSSSSSILANRRLPLIYSLLYIAIKLCFASFICFLIEEEIRTVVVLKICLLRLCLPKSLSANLRLEADCDIFLRRLVGDRDLSL